MYTVLLAWSIAHHERWFDESQSWLVARDCSLWDMLTHRLRYEGATPMWHLILWVFTRLHITGDEDFGREVILTPWMALLPPGEHLGAPMLHYLESHGY